MMKNKNVLIVGGMFAVTWLAFFLTSFLNRLEEVRIEQEGSDNTEQVQVTVTATGPADAAVEEHLRQIECLALNIYHESRGDSFAGQAAVADVVLNRVSDTYYPNTVCEVVHQTVWIENWKGNLIPKRNQCQFSWFCDGMSDEPGDPDAYQTAYYLAEEVYEKQAWRGLTDGSTHYHALQVRPKWTGDRGMVYKGTIGQHEFYKWTR